MTGNRGDQPDSAETVGVAKELRRSVALVTVDGQEGANPGQFGADVGSGHTVFGGISKTAADGHIFDKADLPRVLQRKSGKVGNFIGIDAKERDHVDLQRCQPGRFRRFDASEDLLQTFAAGDGEKTLGAQGVETDIDAAETGGLQRVGVFSQKEAVGCEDDFRRSRQSGESTDEVNNTPAHQWLPAGDTNLRNTETDGSGGNSKKLFVAENFLVTQRRNPLLGHAIATAQIAAVGNREAQIINGTAVGIYHRIPAG